MYVQSRRGHCFCGEERGSSASREPRPGGSDRPPGSPPAILGAGLLCVLQALIPPSPRGAPPSPRGLQGRRYHRPRVCYSVTPPAVSCALVSCPSHLFLTTRE